MSLCIRLKVFMFVPVMQMSDNLKENVMNFHLSFEISAVYLWNVFKIQIQMYSSMISICDCISCIIIKLNGTNSFCFDYDALEVV